MLVSTAPTFSAMSMPSPVVNQEEEFSRFALPAHPPVHRKSRRLLSPRRIPVISFRF